MIRHVIDRYQLLTVSGDDTGHELLELIGMLWPDQALPSLHSENNLDVDLCIRIRHSKSLLTELIVFWGVGYKYAAPTELIVFWGVGYKYVAPNGANRVLGVGYKYAAPNGADRLLGRRL